MARLRFIFNIVKVLRFPLHFFGLHQLRFSESRKLYQQRANICRFLSAMFISLILIVHKIVSGQWEKQIQLFNALNIEKRPLRSDAELWSEKLTSLFIFLTLFWCLGKKCLLWKLINEAQLAYKHLKSLLGNHVIVECSWLVFIYAILLLLLLTIFEVQIVIFNWPKINTERRTITITELYEISNYIMGIPRKFFVLIMALHILYHLMNAGWLESLNALNLQRNLTLYQFHTYNIFSLQKRLNILAGHYFRMSYICYLFIMAFRIDEFLHFLRFDSNEFVQQHKSQEDLEDEAAWAGQENLTNLRDPLWKSLLLLFWHLAFWFLLLASAYLQQEEYLKLMKKSWNFKSDENGCEMKEFLINNKWNGHSFKQLDILDIMFLSGISICERQHDSICFMTDIYRKKNSSYQNLNIIAGHFKLILCVLIFFAVVYFMEQTELRQLQEYLKHNS
ncbi:uncharacterized protein LOC128259304 [Drosophila gunungcola]|uniref:uncharacterized protein LOC128259304 n=1 Tax=Drosophila gunungcola TaxID=103775 RepID=UPI0022E71617|nr:uncharacterized protein LOC128259304 [Drosophila gunungcola]